MGYIGIVVDEKLRDRIEKFIGNWTDDGYVLTDNGSQYSIRGYRVVGTAVLDNIEYKINTVYITKLVTSPLTEYNYKSYTCTVLLNTVTRQAAIVDNVMFETC